MRLKKETVEAIFEAVASFAGRQSGWELRLFGSRTKDHLKGGDIDLLLVMQEGDLVEKLLLEKHRILSAIKARIGDQKIDLKISTRKNIDRDPFLTSIFESSLLLKK